MLTKTTNKSITSAYTEYSHTFQRNVKKFTIQCRSANDVRLAFEDTDVQVTAPSGAYFTLKSGTKYESPDGVNHSGLTVYIAAATGSLVVEISEWY